MKNNLCLGFNHRLGPGERREVPGPGKGHGPPDEPTRWGWEGSPWVGGPELRHSKLQEGRGAARDPLRALLRPGARGTDGHPSWAEWEETQDFPGDAW